MSIHRVPHPLPLIALLIRQDTQRIQRAGGNASAFGRVLREVPKERGMPFNSGYRRTYISFFEQGKKNPTLSTVFDLAVTLKMTASEIVRSVETRLK